MSIDPGAVPFLTEVRRQRTEQAMQPHLNEMERLRPEIDKEKAQTLARIAVEAEASIDFWQEFFSKEEQK